MKNSAPEKMNVFKFNTKALFRFDASILITPLKNIAPRIIKKFYAYYIDMDSNELVDILSASKNWTGGIYLYYWKIDSSKELVVGNKLDGWLTKSIFFNHSGKDDFSGWESDLSKLEVIIRGLSQYKDLSINLKNIYMHANNLDQDDVRDIMNKYNLDDIRIYT